MKNDKPVPNIEVLCGKCGKGKYPLKGRFSEATAKKAVAAKFNFKNPNHGKFDDGRGAQGENMWVKINEVKAGKVYGILNNDPFILENLKYGDKVVRKLNEVMELEFQ